MFETISIDEFLEKGKLFPIVDTRSPKEYLHGHIPNAINIPLFSDEERHQVGIKYKLEGKEAATILGMQFVSKKLENLTLEIKNISAEKNNICIYCWRGGMRSKGVAWLASSLKINTFRLNSGYKIFRKKILESFKKKTNFIVIGGYTGTGKTNLLIELKKNGMQIIDIEKIAHHRGSAFGGIGEKKFPTQEQFENELGWQLMQLDTAKNIFIEDESRLTGKLVLPEEFWKQIRASKVIFIDLPKNIRIKNLVEEYGKMPIEELTNSFLKLNKRIGSEKTKRAINFLNENNFSEAADIALAYYDKLYDEGLLYRDKNLVEKLQIVNSENGNKTNMLNALLANVN